MKTFLEWIEANNLEEGLGRNLLTLGLMGLGSLGAAGCSDNKCVKQNQPAAAVQQDQININLGGARKVTAILNAGEDNGNGTVRFLGSKLSFKSNSDLASQYAKTAILKAAGLSRGHIQEFEITGTQQQGNWIITNFQWTGVK
jgi:hypothetical protein